MATSAARRGGPLAHALDSFLALFREGTGLIGRLSEGRKPSWSTPRYALAPRHIAGALTSWTTDSPRYVGLRFQTTTRHGLIDIDTDSPYHTPEHFSRLLDTAARLGFILTPCQSSDSGGWHFYLTFADWVPSDRVGDALEHIAREAGLQVIAKGTAELYPHRNNPRHGVRLPGQPGFAWLDSEGLPTWYCIPGTLEGNLERVVTMFESRANDPDVLEELPARSPEPPRAIARPRGRKPTKKSRPYQPGTLPPVSELHLQPGMAKAYDKKSQIINRPMFFDPMNPYGIAWFKLGQELYTKGLQNPSSRNTALQAVGFFLLFCGIADERDRSEILELWLSGKHNGKSRDWEANQKAVRAEIVRMTEWTSKKKPSNEEASRIVILDPYQRANQRRHDKARALLLWAVQQLKQAGDQITYQAIQEKTGLSRSTIAKHRRELGPTWGAPEEVSTAPTRKPEKDNGANSCSKPAPRVASQPIEIPRLQVLPARSPSPLEVAGGLYRPEAVEALRSQLTSIRSTPSLAIRTMQLRSLMREAQAKGLDLVDVGLTAAELEQADAYRAQQAQRREARTIPWRDRDARSPGKM